MRTGPLLREDNLNIDVATRQFARVKPRWCTPPFSGDLSFTLNCAHGTVGFLGESRVCLVDLHLRGYLIEDTNTGEANVKWPQCPIYASSEFSRHYRGRVEFTVKKVLPSGALLNSLTVKTP